MDAADDTSATAAAPYDRERLTEVLRAYADDPLDDGHAVLLVDDAVCFEVAGLARERDEQVRGTAVEVLPVQALPAALSPVRSG